MTKRLTIALIALAMFVLVAVMPVSAYYYNVAPKINQGATVFVGEQGLNVTYALNKASYAPTVVMTAAQFDATPTNFTVGWYASSAGVTTTAPTNKVDLSLGDRYKSFTVTDTEFALYPGIYYLINPASGTAYVSSATQGTTTPAGIAVFTVADPTLSVSIWDTAQGASVNDASVPQGTVLAIGVSTNMYQALDPTYRYPVRNLTGNSQSTLTQVGGEAPAQDGYVDIKVKDASGAVLTSLLGPKVTTGDSNGVLGVAVNNSIVAQNVSTANWKWGYAAGSAKAAIVLDPVTGLNRNGNWSTDAVNTQGQQAYPAGTYIVWAESMLNKMNDNYKNAGAAYTGKTVAQTHTITLVSDTVKITADKDSVVRSKSFSVTITGKPSTTYVVWVKGTSNMAGTFDDEPPMINSFQAGVKFDTNTTSKTSPPVGESGNITALGALYQNGAGNSVGSDVSRNDRTYWGARVAANISTAASGVRTIEFITSNWTKAQKYTIHVERNESGVFKSDEVDVKVEKGAVTIVAAGDQSYYLGEEIKFSGTNTESANTYLLITGPNLGANGGKLTSPHTEAVGGDHISTAVNGDNTWSYKWGTSAIQLDAGTYTVYALSQSVTKTAENLGKIAYGTVSIIIKKPFVSATASQSTVAQGDNIFITGTAEGNPSPGVAVWVLGKNYATYNTESVGADASFKHEVKKEDTKTLFPGQYFVVVQHPMQNNRFDIITSTGTTGSLGSTVTYVNNLMLNEIAGAGAGINVFKIAGSGSLQGSDAAEALVQAINNPNVDDTYTKLQFLVEVPVIRIDPVGDKHVGDKFTITATTNLAVDDEVLAQAYSSSFKPTQKSQSGEFSGATSTLKVTKGDSGMNKLSFSVDSSTFKPDEYIVTMDAVLQVATGTALFNVLEGAAPTAAPTVVVTAAPTAAVVTAAPTAAPTAVPTPVPTTKSPGYGALIALIGLGAVAFIVVRRH